VSDIIVDSDGEMILGIVLDLSSKIPLTIAGVNSFEERP
jgi:hypothetical protein